MSLTTVYKPGQGKWVRWCTAAAVVLVVGLGLYWFLKKTPMSTTPIWLQIVIGLVLGVGGIVLALWIVNREKTAEFMILTESEMRKVNWPNTSTVVGQTKVVIVLTLIMAALLVVVDLMFFGLFHWIKLY